jgi:hypothetical protein
VAATKAAFEDVAVIGFKNVQAGVEQLTFRDDDDVEPWRFVAAMPSRPTPDALRRTNTVL